ncbi:DUF1456 family protein [Catenovulum maritimum]|uniref:DUF1456 family protein n=1 Tax=Catenovulum maritimum TaxID=1513271 RepID=UPI00097C7D3E
MTNNDILRRIRYTFDYTEHKMSELIASAGKHSKPELITQWLKKDDDPDYVRCSDREFSSFLNGFINDKRGQKEDGTLAVVEDHLNNNIIFMKLKIALNLKAEDIIEILELTEFFISKHELSAFFRRVSHQHYRECQDQVLRRFLMGMQLKYKDNQKSAGDSPYANIKKSAINKAKNDKYKAKKSFDKPKRNPKAEGITYGEYANNVKVGKVENKPASKTKPTAKKKISKASFNWSDIEK